MNEKEVELNWQKWDTSTQKVACLLSLFAVSPFHWSLVEKCFPNQNAHELENILNHLLNVGLLQEPDEDIYLVEDSYDVPEQFQDFLRDKLENSDFSKELKRNFSQTMVALGKQLTEALTRAELKIFAQNIPHLELVVTELQDFLQNEDIISLFISLGRFYRFQVEYESAISLLEAGLTTAKDRLGAEHPDVATILDNLADTYSIKGDYEVAESFYQQALQIRKKLQGQNHVDVAISLTNLAQIYKLQERYGDAETFFRVALAQRKNLLGKKHPDVATSINNLGTVFLAQERYDEAEQLLTEALELRKQLSGIRSLEVANSLTNLGELYSWKERYDKAEQLLTEALEIRKNLLGSDHSDVLTNLNDLAEVYEFQERYQEAKVLYTEAMETADTVLGEEHPKTQAIRRNLKLFLYELQEKSNYSLNSELKLYQPDGEPLSIQALELTVEVEEESVTRCGLSFQVSPELYQDITSKELFHLEARMQLYSINNGFEADRDLEIQVELSPDLLSDLTKEAKTPAEVGNYLLGVKRKQSQLPLLNTESWYGTSIRQWVPLDADLGGDALIKTGYNTPWTTANKIKLQFVCHK